MTACPTHGALLGGYVLGSLEPAEMDEMRRHVADCPYCGPEARALGVLPTLLDSIDLAEVPPPTLPTSVEEAVLDRFTRERASQRRPRRRFSLRLPRVAVAGVACVAAVVIALLVAGGNGEVSHAYASAKLAPVGHVQTASAVAWAEDVPAGTRVRLRARGLPTSGKATYELWCIRSDGRWISGGTFRAAADGRAEAMLTAGVRPGDYHVMVVTRHSGGEADHGPALLRGELRY
ncbi:MAG TPA: anti-sigma factor [Thermoleophilaceae bacterium]|nr:anti-sigma factor [Thermoleophilaceae bacterium]